MGKKSSPKMPAAPDYSKLTQQQGELNKDAAFDTTLANRANQYNPNGSLTWDVDPNTGQWSQNISMTDENQYMSDLIRGAQFNALGQYTDQAGNPIDTSNMTDWSLPNLGDIDTSGLQDWQMPKLGELNTSGLTNWGDPSKLQAGFGQVKEVQDAMMRMLQPGLDKRRDAEVARLKAQGITEMSDPWNSSQYNLAQGENEASDRALMSSLGAYNDVFNRQLQANQYSDTLRGKQSNEMLGFRDQAFDEAGFANKLRGSQYDEMMGLRNQAFGESDYANKLRQAQFGEAEKMRSMPIEDFSNLSQALATLDPRFAGYGGATGAAAPDMLGAAGQQYSDQISRYNAEQARKSSTTGSILGTVGTIGGAVLGGPVGAAIGGSIGGMLGGGGGSSGAYAAQPPGGYLGGSGGLKVPWATSVYS